MGCYFTTPLLPFFPITVSLPQAKAMIQKYSSQSLLTALEYARKLLVNAMKFGKTLVVRMGTSAPDFKDTYHDNKLHEMIHKQYEAKRNKASKLDMS